MNTPQSTLAKCIAATVGMGMATISSAPIALAAAAATRTPVVLATDIGGDIDDTWALAHLLRSPELDLKMILTDNGDARYRARVTAKFLEVAGRTDVHVGLGPSTGDSEEKDQNQGPWVRDYDLSRYPGPVHADGVGAFLELVRSSPVTVTVIAIGPAPSLAEAVRRDPLFAKRCRLVGMFGSFDVGYDGASTAAAEWNVRADVNSLRTVMGALAGGQNVRIDIVDTDRVR